MLAGCGILRPQQFANELLCILESNKLIMIVYYIFCKIGTIWSNLGRLVGSAFQHNEINLLKDAGIPGCMGGRQPSVAICKKQKTNSNIIFSYYPNDYQSVSLELRIMMVIQIKT